MLREDCRDAHMNNVVQARRASRSKIRERILSIKERTKVMTKNIVIGIDHGWSLIKTSDFIFTTGVKELTTQPAFPNHILEFENKYYAIGEKRLIVKDTKVENENFYLLTLAAIAMELRKRETCSSL